MKCHVDLAKLDKDLPLTALGVIGFDENGRYIEESLSNYKSIDLSQIVHEGCIINEIEAESTTGIALRNDKGILEENMSSALAALKAMGVSKWAVIHAAEGGYGLDCTSGEIVKLKSLNLPDGYIKGTNGAGDAFCSGVLYGAYLEKFLSEAIELGIGCAACSLSEPGATEGMRCYEEVIKLYNEMKLNARNK